MRHWKCERVRNRLKWNALEKSNCFSFAVGDERTVEKPKYAQSFRSNVIVGLKAVTMPVVEICVNF